MTILLLDAEWNGDEESVVHVVCTKVYGRDERKSFRDLDDLDEYIKELDPRRIIIHAGLTADVPVINKVANRTILDPSKVIDTFVVSRTLNYKKFQKHSLAEIGKFLGVYKGDYTGGWDCYTPEMEDYCAQDVEVLEAIFRYFKPDLVVPRSFDSLRTEMKTATGCREMQDNGFLVDRDILEDTLRDVLEDMKVLEESFEVQFPPVLKEVKEIKYRVRKDGALFANVEKALTEYPETKVVDGMLKCYDYVHFKPGSPKDRIDVLWDAGWEPYDRTKGHIQEARKRPSDPERMEHFKRYGWKCNEDNLATLPDSAPQGAKDLARWLTLEGRRSTLVELIGAIGEDGRIHGKYWHIGAWTHRMSHSSPNQGNLPAVFEDTPTTPVEEIKHKYNGAIREAFIVPEGSWLVGVDADSIQLRILCHYLKSEEYKKAILSGEKEKGTDIHNVNREALGLSWVTRAQSKTFIYAWLLGAGVAKVASILKASTSQAKKAVDDFIKNTHGLAKLKRQDIPFDARRGYFIGLDGRKVQCDSEHHMLSGYLQNGEAVIMKKAKLIWEHKARREGLVYKCVNFVHDEWQTEVIGSRADAERMGEIQCEALATVGHKLGLFCPLEGTAKIGKNWKDTH